MQVKEFLYDWFGYNKIIFIVINKFTNNVIFLPNFLKYLSVLFNISNFTIYYFIAVGVCYIYLKNQSLNGRKEAFANIYNYLVRIGISYAVIGLSYALFKFTVNLSRPFCSLSPAEFITIANISKERCLSSFPSAHTALSVLIAYYAWPFIALRTQALLILNILLIMVSRITLAMHYPADLIYSLILVITLIGLAEKIYILFKNNIIAWIGTRIYFFLFSKK